MKRNQVRIILVILACALSFVILCRCGDTEVNIEDMAQEYLSQQYTAEFTITKAWRMTTNRSPIPSLFRSHYWKLDVVSSRFPDDTFQVYYAKDHVTGRWSWSDDYYTLLLHEEAQAYFSNIIEKYFEKGYLVDFSWGVAPWPNGTGEETSFQEWLEAGGHISGIDIYLKETELSDQVCRLLAKDILGASSSIATVDFFSMDSEGFDQATNQNVKEIWNENESCQLGLVSYIQGAV